MTWLRLTAVVAALAAIAIGARMSALAGPLPTTGAVVAIAEASLAVATTKAAAQRTQVP